MPSLAREGLDKLLMLHPDAEVARVWNQDEGIAADQRTGPPFDPSWAVQSGPWTCVDLWVGPLGMLRFAIWNGTGAVYELDEDGAVEEDPIIEAPPV